MNSELETSPISQEFTNVIHRIYNAWVPWRADPLLANIFDQTKHGTFVYSIVLLVIFWIGSAAFLGHASERRLKAIFTSLVLSGFIYMVFKIDPIVLGSIAWVPALALTLQLLLESKSPNYLILVLFFSLRCANSALFLAPLSFTISFILALVLKKGPTNLRLMTTAAITCVAAIELTFFSLPGISALDYPSGAQLVPDDLVPGITRPLIGFDPPIPSIDNSSVQRQFGLMSLLVCAFFITFSIRKPTGPAWWSGIAMSAVVAFDIFASPKLAQIGPVASISRLLPGLFVFPLHPTIMALAVLCFTLYLSIRNISIHLILLSLGVIGYLSEHKFEISLPTNEIESKILNSPSAYIFRAFGASQVNLASRYWRNSFRPIGDIVREIAVSNKNESSHNLIDGDLNTAWSSSGPQFGNEWILVSLKAPTSIKALRLESGQFKSDFSRGLEITTSESPCSYESSPLKDETIAFRMENWLGNLSFTESYLPYLSGQASPVVYIDSMVSCLLIKQIGHDSRFSWTITELEISNF